MRPHPGWPRPRGLLLDAMGTLIGLRQPLGEGYAAVAAGLGLQLDAAAISQAFPTIYRQAPPLAFPGLEGDALRQAELTWWGERIAAVLAASGAPPAPATLTPALFQHYSQAQAWRVYADVPEHLARWRAQGLRLAVVSNFDGRLPGLLAELGLADWLDAVVVSSSAGAAKPDPAPLHQALAALDLEPHQAWHVGDSPEDEAGARAAGLPCLLVRRR
jgi:putative hydrolase of the HAD superfamily